MRYHNYEVTAQNKRTGRMFTDTFYCTSEAAARRDFRDVYRHGDDYTILGVKPEAGYLTDEEYAKLAQIACAHIPALSGRGDLETMNSDSLDFFETSVWCLEEALAAAYRAGKEAGAKEEKKG